MRKFDLERVSRGVRQNVPNILQCEVWKHWESVTKPDTDSVAVIELSPHVLRAGMEKIVINPPKKVFGLRTAETVEADLIVTYFDKEATMMLRSEAEEIFGHLLPEYLEEQKKEGVR